MSDPPANAIVEGPAAINHPTIDLSSVKASSLRFTRIAWNYRFLILCVFWIFTYNRLLNERYECYKTQNWLRICAQSRDKAKQAEEWRAWSNEREHYLQLQKDHEQLKKRCTALEYAIVGMRHEEDHKEADKKKSEDDYWLERSTWGGPWDRGGPEPL